MKKSHNYKSHNAVDYYLLPNGKVDVFLHRNEITETDEEGNITYIADEVYLSLDSTIPKQEIEQNFDTYWNKGENTVNEPSVEERMKALEQAMLDIISGGGAL